MEHETTPEASDSTSRRKFLGVAAVGATAAWTAPSITGIGAASAASAIVPEPCVGGTDPHFDSEWVVCTADADRAWISSVNPVTQSFHAEEICVQLGYVALGSFGGNCGSVCGYCEGGTSCDNPGTRTFDGSGNEGTDANGQILGSTVTWECLATGVAPTKSPVGARVDGNTAAA